MNLDEVNFKLKDTKFFSVFNATKGLLHQLLNNRSKLLTAAMLTPLGVHVFNVLAMGLSNSNNLFESALRELLQGLKGVVNITDDILIFGSTQQEHDHNVITFLERCLEVDLKLNQSKIRLTVLKCFLDGTFQPKDIKLDPNKVKAIKDWPTPSNVKELQGFLEFVNYLFYFVPELSSLRTPLQPSVKTNTDFIWLQSHTEAFERINNAISNDCLLQFYDVLHPILIECDASKKGLGCILLQPTDKNVT